MAHSVYRSVIATADCSACAHYDCGSCGTAYVPALS